MAEKSFHEVFAEAHEEHKDEIDEMAALGTSFANRDSIPNNYFERVLDAEGNFSGYAFDFVMPWYTGYPLSTIMQLDVSINGTAINREQVSIIIRDMKIPVKVARTIYEIWWSFGEMLKIQIDQGDEEIPLSTGKNLLEVYFEMRTTIHYGFPDDIVKGTISRNMEVK